MTISPNEFSFLEHLEELRSRLIKAVVAIILTACFFYPAVDQVLTFLIHPVEKVVFTSPADALAVRLTLTFWGGVVLSLPVIVYQFWRFIAAGLKGHEKQHIRFFAPFSLVLFVAGGVFGYTVMIPIGMKFLLSFATDSIVPMITIKNYISFVTTFILAFGVAFELPIILIFLARLGIVTPAFLAQKRRHAIVIILIVSAVITPPDLVMQMVVTLPLVILYELGTLVARIALPAPQIASGTRESGQQA